MLFCFPFRPFPAFIICSLLLPCAVPICFQIRLSFLNLIGMLSPESIFKNLPSQGGKKISGHITENDFFTRILLLYRSVCPYSAITSFFLPPRSKKHSQNKAAANLCNNLGSNFGRKLVQHGNELVRQLWRQTSMAACIGPQKYSGKHLSMFRRESAACKKIVSDALQFSGKKQQSENILLPTAA